MQADCKSNNLDNLEVLVFGEGDFKKRGLMCSGCFIDDDLLSKMKSIEEHSLPIQ